MPHDSLHLSRRAVLGAATGLVAGSALADAPKDAATIQRPSAAPRATSGDRAEPDWSERLTITVGPKKADLVGSTDKVIQAAVDLVSRMGGGTVRLLPGTYRLRNAIYLQSGLRLVGAGVDTVLLKEPSVTAKLVEDSDWYDQEITLADGKGFAIGDGVCFRREIRTTAGRS